MTRMDAGSHLLSLSCEERNRGEAIPVPPSCKRRWIRYGLASRHTGGVGNWTQRLRAEDPRLILTIPHRSRR